jgi:predicted CXXCH cytochrome family protein
MRQYNPGLPVDQMELYATSRHGQKNREGDTRVATCTSCHGVHAIQPAAEPKSAVHPTNVAATCNRCHGDSELMSVYGLPADQYEDYQKSVHWTTISEGNDLSAPTCNDCHGNHGASPPGVGSIELVCGNCHAMQRQLFDQGPHREGFAEVGDPECDACHGNHNVRFYTDEFLGVEEEQLCSNCHDEDESAWDTALELRADLEDLKAKLESAIAMVERSAVAGMEMSDAELVLIDANQSLVMARNAVHAVTLETLKEHTDQGRTLAEEAQQMGVAALGELDFRRKGLAVSVIFILVLVFGIYLKIREIESTPES